MPFRASWRDRDRYERANSDMAWKERTALRTMYELELVKQKTETKRHRQTEVDMSRERLIVGV